MHHQNLPNCCIAPCRAAKAAQWDQAPSGIRCCARQATRKIHWPLSISRRNTHFIVLPCAEPPKQQTENEQIAALEAELRELQAERGRVAGLKQRLDKALGDLEAERKDVKQAKAGHSPLPVSSWL